MAIVTAVLMLIAFFAAEWFVRAALVTPLPKSVRCVFPLDDGSEQELEACVRGFRFLKKHGLIRGELILEMGEASEHTRRAALILARRGDITITEKEE